MELHILPLLVSEIEKLPALVPPTNVREGTALISIGRYTGAFNLVELFAIPKANLT